MYGVAFGTLVMLAMEAGRLYSVRRSLLARALADVEHQGLARTMRGR